MSENRISDSREVSRFNQGKTSRQRPQPQPQPLNTEKMDLPNDFYGKLLAGVINESKQIDSDATEKINLFKNPEIIKIFIEVMEKINFQSPNTSNESLRNLYLSFTSVLQRKHQAVLNPTNGEVAQSDFKESDNKFIIEVTDIINKADSSDRFRTRTLSDGSGTPSQVIKTFHFMNEFNKLYKEPKSKK